MSVMQTPLQIIGNALMPLADPQIFRLVCRDWWQLSVDKKITVHDATTALFLFDDEIYDGNVYRRIILKKTMQQHLDGYRKLRIPEVVAYGADLGDELFYVMDRILPPTQLRLFFINYVFRPNPNLKLFLPQTLLEYVDNFIKTFDNYRPGDQCDLVCLLPICCSAPRDVDASVAYLLYIRYVTHIPNTGDYLVLKFPKNESIDIVCGRLLRITTTFGSDAAELLNYNSVEKIRTHTLPLNRALSLL